MTIVKRLNLYEDKTWSVWAKFQFSASPQTLPAIALNHIQTDRCDSVNTGVQLIAFCQSCFPLTMKMWNGKDHEELLKDPKQNSRTKLHRFRVSEERVLLNIWTYPDRWMLLNKPFNIIGDELLLKLAFCPNPNNFPRLKAREIIRIWTKRAWNYFLISLVTIWLPILTPKFLRRCYEYHNWHALEG